MPGESLQDRVRAAKTTREAGKIVRVPIPGYQDKLIGVYGIADWQTRVTINVKRMELAQSNGNFAESLWELAADHLLASSQSTEAVDGDDKADLELPLGVGLAAWLGCDMEHVDSDRGALSLIIEDGEDLIEHFGRVLAAQGRSGGESDQELVGESKAAS